MPVGACRLSFGSFYVSGLQTGTPSGGQQSLGPFAIAAFSDTNDTQSVVVNTTATVNVPASALGVWIIPPLSTGTVSLSVRTVIGDTGIFIAPDSPTYLAFDEITPNIPAELYLVSGGNVTVTIQFV